MTQLIRKTGHEGKKLLPFLYYFCILAKPDRYIVDRRPLVDLGLKSLDLLFQIQLLNSVEMSVVIVHALAEADPFLLLEELLAVVLEHVLSGQVVVDADVLGALYAVCVSAAMVIDIFRSFLVDGGDSE